jgi:hypothetical protein
MYDSCTSRYIGPFGHNTEESPRSHVSGEKVQYHISQKRESDYSIEEMSCSLVAGIGGILHGSSEQRLAETPMPTTWLQHHQCNLKLHEGSKAFVQAYWLM